jgi:hypothetical protein
VPCESGGDGGGGGGDDEHEGTPGTSGVDDAISWRATSGDKTMPLVL